MTSEAIEKAISAYKYVLLWHPADEAATRAALVAAIDAEVEAARHPAECSDGSTAAMREHGISPKRLSKKLAMSAA